MQWPLVQALRRSPAFPFPCDLFSKATREVILNCVGPYFYFASIAPL